MPLPTGTASSVFGDRRQRQDLPAPLLHQVAGRSSGCKALHNEHDGACVDLVVEAAQQRVAEPLLALQPKGFRLSVPGFIGSSMMGIATAAGKGATGRGGEPEAALRRPHRVSARIYMRADHQVAIGEALEKWSAYIAVLA